MVGGTRCYFYYYFAGLFCWCCCTPCKWALSDSGKMCNYIIAWTQLIHRDWLHTGVSGLSKMLTLCFYGNQTTHWSYCHTWRQELQWQQRKACWWFGDEMKRNQVKEWAYMSKIFHLSRFCASFRVFYCHLVKMIESSTQTTCLWCINTSNNLFHSIRINTVALWISVKFAFGTQHHAAQHWLTWFNNWDLREQLHIHRKGKLYAATVQVMANVAYLRLTIWFV